MADFSDFRLGDNLQSPIGVRARQDLALPKTTPVVSSNTSNPFNLGDKKGMPLDLGVTLAGMLAHSIAPDEWGGRMGKDVANLGGRLFEKRLDRERTAPERDIQRRIGEAQIRNLNKPDLMEGATGVIAEKKIGTPFYKTPKYMKSASGKMVEEGPGVPFYKPPEIPRDLFEPFGEGQLRNKLTGELVDVPTKSLSKSLSEAQIIALRTGKLSYIDKALETWSKDISNLAATPEEKATKKKQLGIAYDEAISGKKATDNVMVKTLRDPKTGDVVHLNAAGEEIKRIRGKSTGTNKIRRPIDFKGSQNAK